VCTRTENTARAPVAVIVVSWFTGTPMTLGRCVDAMLDALRIMVPTAILLVAVGLVVNVVTTTGLGNAFSVMIVDWAGGSLLLTLVLVALASLILGMGLPVTASYIVLATLAAPALYAWIGMDGLFEMTGGLALLAILVTLFVVPPPIATERSAPPAVPAAGPQGSQRRPPFRESARRCPTRGP